MSKTLREYILDARKKGYSNNDIAKKLKEHNYPVEFIRKEFMKIRLWRVIKIFVLILIFVSIFYIVQKNYVETKSSKYYLLRPENRIFFSRMNELQKGLDFTGLDYVTIPFDCNKKDLPTLYKKKLQNTYVIGNICNELEDHSKLIKKYNVTVITPFTGRNIAEESITSNYLVDISKNNFLLDFVEYLNYTDLNLTLINYDTMINGGEFREDKNLEIIYFENILDLTNHMEKVGEDEENITVIILSDSEKKILPENTYLFLGNFYNNKKIEPILIEKVFSKQEIENMESFRISSFELVNENQIINNITNEFYEEYSRFPNHMNIVGVETGLLAQNVIEEKRFENKIENIYVKNAESNEIEPFIPKYNNIIILFTLSYYYHD